MSAKSYRAFPSTDTTRKALPGGFWSLNADSVSHAKLNMRRVDNVSNVSENGEKGSSCRTDAERCQSVWYERRKNEAWEE